MRKTCQEEGVNGGFCCTVKNESKSTCSYPATLCLCALALFRCSASLPLFVCSLWASLLMCWCAIIVVADHA